MSRRSVRARKKVAPPPDPPPRPAAAGDDSPGWLERAPLLAALVAIVSYLPSVGGVFLYDDFPLIVDNRSIRGLASLATVLTYDRARPLLNLSLAVNYAVSGLSPWSYHLANVLIHAANAALVASLFLWMATRAGWQRPRQAALAGACVFAATPMAAETVAYVASRSTALAALFGLLSLRLGVSVLERRSRLRQAASLLFLVLALATKEEAAAVPLLLVLLDFFFVAGQRARDTAARLPIHALPLSVLVLGVIGRRLATGTWLPTAESERLAYAVIEWALFPLYLLRQILPIDPALYRGHGIPWPPSAAVVAMGLVTATLAATAIALRHRRPEWTFAVAWLAIGLLPSSSLVPLGEPMADHRAYLGGAGVAFCIGGLLSRVRQPMIVAGIVALMAARSWQYQWVLADPVRAWDDVCRRTPGSGVAWRSLADARLEKGDAGGAEAAFRRALEVDPRDAKVRANLGVLYGNLGRLDDAERTLRGALDVASAAESGAIHDDLGMILRALGREEEAAGEFERAIVANPRLAQPRISLAQILVRRGEKDRARALLDDAVKTQPTQEQATWIEQLRRGL